MIISHIRNPYSMVIARNWEWAGIFGIFLSKFIDSKYIYFRSFPHNENYQLVLSNRDSRIRKKVEAYLLLQMHDPIIRKADAVIVMSDAMKNEMIERGFNKNKLHVIGLGYDKSWKVNNHKVKKLQEKYRTSKNKILLYFGKMDEKRELEFLLDILKDVCKKNKDVKLIMLGGNPKDMDRLKAKSIEFEIDENVYFVGKILRNEVPNYLNISYISLSPIPPTSRYMVSSVTKLYESIGFGIPVVGNNLPDQGKIIRESGRGICVEYDKSEFVKAIDYILDNNLIRDRMSKEGATFILNNYSYEILTKKVDSLVKTLVS